MSSSKSPKRLSVPSKGKVKIRLREIGLRARRAREAAGISQAAAAAALGIETSTLSRYENGHSPYQIESLVTLAEMTKIPLPALVDCDRAPAAPAPVHFVPGVAIARPRAARM